MWKPFPEPGSQDISRTGVCEEFGGWGYGGREAGGAPGTDRICCHGLIKANGNGFLVESMSASVEADHPLLCWVALVLKLF